MLRRLLGHLLDAVFPHRCVGCGRTGAPLCSACFAAIPRRIDHDCPACGRPRPDGTPCTRCRTATHLDQLITATALDGTVADAVYALKYRGIRALATPLATLLLRSAPRLAVWGTTPSIIPVPLHPTRLRARGYNQSALLADHLASAALTPVEPSALIRVRATASQVRTESRTARRDNMRDAFACPRPADVAGRDIVLVDDVCTTGATLDACARVLKDAGARRVVACTVARG